MKIDLAKYLPNLEDIDIYKDKLMLSDIIEENSYALLLSFIYNKYKLANVITELVRDVNELDVDETIHDLYISFDTYILDTLVEENKEIDFIYNLSNIKDVDKDLHDLYVEQDENIYVLFTDTLDNVLNRVYNSLETLNNITILKEDKIIPFKNKSCNVLWDTFYLTVYAKI